MVSKDGVSGTKSIFMLTTPDGGTTYCNVEELVREHYKEQCFLKSKFVLKQALYQGLLKHQGL